MGSEGVDVRLVVTAAGSPAEPGTAEPAPPADPEPAPGSPDPAPAAPDTVPEPDAPVAAPSPALPPGAPAPEAAAPGLSTPQTPADFAPRLPRTGAELLAVLLVAVVLLALGTLLVKAGRARRRPA